MFDPQQHHRRSVRLPHFDYGSAGAYAVTICAARKQNVFGSVEKCVITLNVYGLIVAEEWERTAVVRSEVALDTFIVMPNHFHAILWITEKPVPDTIVGACGGTPKTSQPSNFLAQKGESGAQGLGVPPHAPTFRAPSKSLGALVNGFKGSVTRRVNRYRAERDLPPVVDWQRSFYDRVIRDEKELLATRRYIIENPLHWESDEHLPQHIRKDFPSA